jgi:hypothetical protein
LPAGQTCGTVTNACGSLTVGCSNGQTCAITSGATGTCANTCWGTYSGQCGTGLPNVAGAAALNCPCSGTGNICSSTTTGTPGTCSCPTLKSCASYSGQCGSLNNGCGGTVTCGCTGAHDTCGGGGTPGVCGCTKASCVGTCGIIDDKCGGQLSCGSC